METTIDNKENLLCDKENISLVKLGDKRYKIILNSSNNNINFRNIINFNLYKMLGAVNSKHIKAVELIEQISANKAKFLFLFNPLGADFGIPKKYMYLETEANVLSDNIIEYTSKSIETDDIIQKKIKRYEKITCIDSKLIIEVFDNNNINIQYYFNIDIHEDLPLFAENLIGYIMKKIFLNLKIFIEKIS